jgi:trehalose/maltose hydrolase-like predicted phosphorylase
LRLFAYHEGKERNIKQHRDERDALWNSGDIEITRQPELKKNIRFALYHLYSFVRAETYYSMLSMGLSGLGYNGYVLWDTELWMIPPLLILQPAIAESLLEYLFDRLGAAKLDAFSHGYRGAMFPWESDQDRQKLLRFGHSQNHSNLTQ